MQTIFKMKLFLITEEDIFSVFTVDIRKTALTHRCTYHCHAYRWNGDIILADLTLKSN